MEGAEGQGSRLLLLRCSKTISRLEETDTMPPPPKTQFSQEASQCQGQSWARWQRGSPSASIALEVARGHVASLLGAAHTSDPWCLGSFPSPTRLQEEGSLRLGCRKGAGRGWAGFQKVGQGCAIAFLSDGERSANPHRLSALATGCCY